MKKRLGYLSARVAYLLLLAAAGGAVLLGFLWYAWLRGALPLWPCAVGTLLLAVLAALFYGGVYKPYRRTEKMLGLFAGGYTLEGLFEMPYQTTPATEKAVAYVQELVNSGDLLTASRREAQVLALQNQINPHFLYNTLEGIRGEALAEGCANIADMTEALSTFFRYTISNLEHMVTLEEELANIENYFSIQQYRFGGRISLNIAFENEADRPRLLAEKMPKLTLQPIVENAIVHGVEGKVGPGLVRVFVMGTGRRLLVRVSDDGLGMERGLLEEINRKLAGAYHENSAPLAGRRGGIAVVNVNNRIRLLFGEAYGIHLYSTPGRGTDVEITLPLTGGAEANM